MRKLAAILFVLALCACERSAPISVSREQAAASACQHLFMLRGSPFARSTLAVPLRDDLVTAIDADLSLATLAGYQALQDPLRLLRTRLLGPTRPAPEPSDLSVFLVEGVTRAQRTAVGRFLENHSQVESVRYESSQKAYERFVEIFANQPDVVSGTSASSLPESFRVQLVNLAAGGSLRAEVLNRPGVEEASSRSRVPAVVFLADISGALEELVTVAGCLELEGLSGPI